MFIETNGDARREIAALKTAVAVAESVLAQAKEHMAMETQYRISTTLQLATITERLATQQRIMGVVGRATRGGCGNDSLRPALGYLCMKPAILLARSPSSFRAGSAA